MLNFKMIDVSSVQAIFSRECYNPLMLEALAQEILETGGLLIPIIVKKVGFEKYEIVDGDQNYWASVRASELDPIKGETVNAFILTYEQQISAIRQLLTLNR